MDRAGETNVVADMCRPDLRHSDPSTAAGWEGWPELDPRAFGAKADGVTLDTAAIQAAIDGASAARGGRVVLRGATFLTASLFLKEHAALIIEEGAVLKATTRWQDYPFIRSRQAGVERVALAGIVNAAGVHGVRIAGRGLIDGSGFPWWNSFWAREGRLDKMDPRLRRLLEESPQSEAARDLLERPDAPKPILIGACRDVLVEGIRIHDSPSWTLHVLYSEEVEIRDVTIRNDPPGLHAPSTDGIDIDSCRNVLIHHCDISCHDDCICLKSGRGKDGARVNRPTENVLIHGCVAGAGHALVGLGTEFSGGIRNVVIRDCRSTGTQVGLRFKSNIGNGGAIENVLAENITCVDTAHPIQFRLRDAFGVLEGKREAEPYLPAPAGVPRYRNIVIRGLTASGATTCLNTIAHPAGTFDNVVLENVSMEGESGLQIHRARNWELRGVTHAACEAGPLFDVRDSENVLLPAWYAPGSAKDEGGRAPGGRRAAGRAGIDYFHKD